MKLKRSWLAITVLLLSVSFLVDVLAFPSGGSFPPLFVKRGKYWYDSWGVNRNSWYGEHGYLPQIINESLGVNRELAYYMGETFVNRYPNRIRRAEAILSFVQEWTEYGYDEEYVFMEGEAQKEWAWNPDEMAYVVDQARKNHQVAYGDCEDFSFFCGVLYLAADYDVVIVHPEGHIALMIWLPEYPDANVYWDIGDGKGYGWIWVEATGDRNPLGWTPPNFKDGVFEVYPVKDMPTSEVIKVQYHPTTPSQEDDVTVIARLKGENIKVSSVQLTYKVDGSEEFDVPMEGRGDSIYEAIIPKQNGDSFVKFYVTVIDVEGKTFKSSNYYYTVKLLGFRLSPELIFLSATAVLIVIFLLITLSRAHQRIRTSGI